MLENFTVRTFSEHLGDTFRIYPDAATPLDVVLITASELGGRPEEEPAGHRRPFSIVFRGRGRAAPPAHLPLSRGGSLLIRASLRANMA